MSKRYYWLKLKEDFFRQIAVKKLRKIAGGDTFTIIYLKMLLIAIKANGVVGYDCSEQEFISNLALDIDEDENNVAITVSFLLRNEMLIPVDGDTSDMYMPEAAENSGSEADTAERVRRFRQRQKALHCNGNVTEALQCNADVTPERENEKEKEKESLPPTPPMKEKEKEKEKEKAVNSLNPSDTLFLLEESSESLGLCVDSKDNNTNARARARALPPKKRYAEFVRMTESEYNKLVQRFGDEALAKEAIEVLDNYKGSFNRTYASDYRAILSWVEREVKQRHTAQPMPKQAQSPQAKMQGILDRYLARKEQEGNG